MIIRSGEYEVKQVDDLNWGVFRVYRDPERAPRGKVPTRIADDGAVLKHTGTYHGSLAAALRKAHQLMLADGAEGSEFQSLAELVEASERRVSDMADQATETVR